MTYSFINNHTSISYSIEDGELRARESGGLSTGLPLDRSVSPEKEKRVYHGWFLIGAIGVGFAVITLGTVLLKDGLNGVLRMGPWGGVHCIFLIAGLILMTVFRRPQVSVRFMRGDTGIHVWRDPHNVDAFNRFITDVKNRISQSNDTAEQD
jgi:hypothetical protein